MTDLPSQNPSSNKNNRYFSFVRSLDLFYVIDEAAATKIHQEVQEACERILNEQNNFDLSEVKLPDISDLVFAKYDDEVTWYRCLVTNCNDEKSKFELFYIDYGNTEIVNQTELLCGWTSEQMSVFFKYEPLAYKCKLYGLKHTTNEQSNKNSESINNAKFKQFVANKLFDVQFLKFNKEENIYEVCLNEFDSDSTYLNASVHKYLIMENLGKYKTLSLFNLFILINFCYFNI